MTNQVTVVAFATLAVLGATPAQARRLVTSPDLED